MEEKVLEISYDEAIHIMKKLEYSYKKKGSVLIDKLKAFIEECEKKDNI